MGNVGGNREDVVWRSVCDALGGRRKDVAINFVEMHRLVAFEGIRNNLEDIVRDNNLFFFVNYRFLSFLFHFLFR